MSNKYFCPNCQSRFTNKNCVRCLENFQHDESEEEIKGAKE